MALRDLDLDSVEQRHLEELVERGVREVGRIEYKRDLPGGGDSKRKEFLADVCSFANAGGGDLVYGMDEENGIPTELVGVALEDPDREISKLEAVIRDGLDRRLVGYRSSAVPLANGRHALVIRVPRSFNRPHAVNYKGHFRYYSRTSNAKYPMAAGEVRGAVLASETVADRMRAFRSQRLADIASGEAPADFSGVATVVLHVLPLASFDIPEPSVDLSSPQHFPRGFLPIGTGGNDRYNFDGLVIQSSSASHLSTEGRQPESYALLFRSGAVEAANTSMLWPDSWGQTIPGELLGKELLNSLDRYLALVSHLGVEGPVYVALSLLGVRNYCMASSFRPSTARPIDRDALVVPEVMAPDAKIDRAEVERLMRPVFDRVWNASGYRRSDLYDPEGNWNAS